MTTTNCPDWCTAATDEYPCDGSHLRLDHESARVASGSNFPLVDERGAIFPAISAGLQSAPSEGRGVNLFLWLTGPDFRDGVEVTFPLDHAFGLALDILDCYARAIQEIDRPSPPGITDMQTLKSVVDIIDHNLSWPERDEDWKAEVADRRARREAKADAEKLGWVARGKTGE